MSTRLDRRGVARRKLILDAAIEVFARRGFRASTVAEVAEQAGITAAGVLYHFKTKDELLLEVIRERDRRQAPILEEVASAEGLATLTGAVRFAELAEQEPHLQTLHTVLEIESLDPESPAHDYFEGRNRFLLDGVEANLRALQAAGHVRADVDCARIARQLLAFEHGAAVLWLRNRELSLVELFRDYFDALAERLRA